MSREGTTMRVVATRCWLPAILLLVIPLGTCCSARKPIPTMMKPGEIRSIEVVLFDIGDGVGEVGRCTVSEPTLIRGIVGCMDHAAPNRLAEEFMRLPIIGRLTLRGESGTQQVEFVEAGMNPLVFRLGDVAFARQNGDDDVAIAHHQKYYGHDSAVIDEGMSLHRKLEIICKSRITGEPITLPFVSSGRPGRRSDEK